MLQHQPHWEGEGAGERGLPAHQAASLFELSQAGKTTCIRVGVVCALHSALLLGLPGTPFTPEREQERDEEQAEPTASTSAE